MPPVELEYQRALRKGRRDVAKFLEKRLECRRLLIHGLYRLQKAEELLTEGEEKEQIRKEIGNASDELTALATDRTYLKTIEINNGDDRIGFAKIFGEYVGENVESINVSDPYIRKKYQIELFEGLCEYAIKCCPKLREIHLHTGKSEDQIQAQELNRVEQSMKNRNYVFNVAYNTEKGSNTFHARDVTFSYSDGSWKRLESDRGLDIYVADKGQNTAEKLVGRVCKKTLIHVFKSKSH